MTSTANSLEAISKLQAQIEQLKESAIADLQVRHAALQSEIRSIDLELEKLTGKSPKGKARLLADTPAKRSVTFSELKDLLLVAPEKTLNVRKAGLDSVNIKTLANLNPRDLRLGGKGPWPTVALVK